MWSVRRHLATAVRACAKQSSESSYRSTVLLPSTSFPARIEGQARIDRDRQVVKSHEFTSLYDRQKSSQEGRPRFVLHDGPPYANGDVHLGHAVNKILKDVFCRWKLLTGHCVDFRPGWDCHGLPIEQKVLQSADPPPSGDAVSVRSRAREFAQRTVRDQRKEFRSWGIMADWERPYLTKDADFVRKQMRLFGKLFRDGMVFRSYMPVYWSPSSRTALAESELEYKEDHVSRAVYVRMRLTDKSRAEVLSKCNLQEGGDVYFLIWTTTPWSLVANRAVCYKQDATYTLVRNPEGQNYIIAKALLDNKDLRPLFTNSEATAEISGSDLSGLSYEHPVSRGQSCPALPAPHVTLDAGTGLVHTAPAHGQDDHAVGVEHRLELGCPVGEDGRYTEEAGKGLAGLKVLGEGAEVVLEQLRSRGDVLSETDFVHSYPYDWRTKQPVILRASKQWFIDVGSLKDKALEALKDVTIRPETARSGFLGVLERRPYWCISRQRVWGVPIPSFYHRDDGSPVVTEALVERLCSLVDSEDGADFWWRMGKGDILAGTGIAPEEVEQGTDIMDVWLDSGITCSTLEKGSSGIKKADLYLEGLDQFSGWFYSSLLTSVALQDGSSPYQEIFVHGFTMDDEGRKMSKSLGNVISPRAVTEGGLGASRQPPSEPEQKKKKKGKKSGDVSPRSHPAAAVYGVDCLRLWVAAHASQSSSILAGEGIFAQTKQDLDRIRLIFRFLLGNLPSDLDLDLSSQSLHSLTLTPLDRLTLHLAASFWKDASSSYERRNPSAAFLRTLAFVSSDLSAAHFALSKDRLYCEAEASPRRKSAVRTLGVLLHVLKDAVAPVCPILAQEVEEAHPSVQLSFLSGRDPDWALRFRDDDLALRFEPLLSLQRDVARASQQSGAKLAKCTLSLRPLTPEGEGSLALFEGREDDLAEFFQVPRASQRSSSGGERVEGRFSPSSDGSLSFLLEEDEGGFFVQCPRCRRWTAEKGSELCKRCTDVVTELPAKKEEEESARSL